jgi:hypothetical protein
MSDKNWEDMTTDEKLDRLRVEDQSTRQMVGQISGATQVIKKQIADLEANKK